MIGKESRATTRQAEEETRRPTSMSSGKFPGLQTPPYLQARVQVHVLLVLLLQAKLQKPAVLDFGRERAQHVQRAGRADGQAKKWEKCVRCAGSCDALSILFCLLSAPPLCLAHRYKREPIAPCARASCPVGEPVANEGLLRTCLVWQTCQIDAFHGAAGWPIDRQQLVKSVCLPHCGIPHEPMDGQVLLEFERRGNFSPAFLLPARVA